ncbi:MAG: hypothetical protein ACK5Q5_14865 [Planctomycetaceae bacterium]
MSIRFASRGFNVRIISLIAAGSISLTMFVPRNLIRRLRPLPDQRWRGGVVLRLGAVMGASIALLANLNRGEAEDLSRLVRQLGAEQFELRQTAQQQILDRWPQFQHELNTLSTPPDAESLQRLDLLRQRIDELHRQSLLAELLTDPLGPPPAGLPLWETYSAIVGDDYPARALYREMLTQEPQLLWLAAAQDPEYSAVLTRRLESLDRAIQIGHFFPGEEVTSGKIAVLLLLSLHDQQPAPALLTNVCKNVAPIPEQQEERGDERNPSRPPAHLQCMRRLLSMWCALAYSVPASVRLSKGVKYKLPEAIEPAREILLSSQSKLVDRKDALLALARFGKHEHLRDIEPWLGDATVVDKYRHHGATIRQTQLRDLALLAAVQIAGEAPEEFGFDSLHAERDKSYSVYSIGFQTEEARDQALHKWRSWQRKHMRSELFDRLDAIEGETL